MTGRVGGGVQGLLLHRPSRRDEHGAVTAETAVALPVLVLVAIAGLWLIAFGVAEIRVADAGREAARAAARGESASTVRALAGRVAPAGARVEVVEQGGHVVVTVSAPVRGPGGLLGFVPARTARGRAVAALEPAP